MIVIPRFLDLQTCLDITRHIDDRLMKHELWKINKGNWDTHLTRGFPGAVYLTDFRDHMNEVDKKVCWKIQNSEHIEGEINWEETRLNVQVWDTGSGCNWHCDNHVDFACTIYLNDRWEKEWGGLLKYRPHDEDKFVVPETGKMVINTDRTFHMVTEQKAPFYRYTLQCFGKYK